MKNLKPATGGHLCAALIVIGTLVLAGGTATAATSSSNAGELGATQVTERAVKLFNAAQQERQRRAEKFATRSVALTLIGHHQEGFVFRPGSARCSDKDGDAVYRCVTRATYAGMRMRFVTKWEYNTIYGMRAHTVELHTSS